MADRYLPNIDVEKESAAPTDWKVVSSDGDAKHWDIVVQGRSPKSADELLGNFGRALEEQARWSPATTASAAAVKGGTGMRSRSWSFQDLDGKVWSGTLTVSPVAGASGEYTARLVVARNG
jgi:hypothetical protein